MKTFANWMTVIFMIMYWGFRIFVTIMYTTGKDFPVTPPDTIAEIVLLFITFMCIVLVFKRQRVGGFIYFATYLVYFGYDIYSKIFMTATVENVVMDTVEEASEMTVQTMGSGINIFTSGLGIVMAIVVLIDILSYNMKTHLDRSTDWYYQNKDLDRKKDSRDDSNNYRIY